MASRPLRKLAQLLDVNLGGSPNIGDILTFQGAWTNYTLAEAGIAALVHSHVSADITDATDLSTAGKIVKRDGAGKFSTVKITTATGAGSGINIGNTNVYETVAGTVRVAGSLTIDGQINGSGAGLISIPNTAIVGLGTSALKNADNTANNTVLLDPSGLLPTSVLPPLAINKVDTVASQAAMLALVSQRGDMAIRTDSGKTYVLASDSPTTLADWQEITAAGSVISVNAKTGTVVLTTSDITEGTHLYYTTARVNADAPNVTIDSQGLSSGLSITGQVLTLPLATSGNAGAMSTAYATELSNATDANTASQLVKRDASGYIAATRITASTGSGNGIFFGTTNLYESIAGILRTSGSITADSGFNGTGANLTSIPQTAINTLVSDLAAKAPTASPALTGNATAQTITASKAVIAGTVVATYASSYTTDATLGNSFFMTLGGPLTLANPTGGVDGQEIDWFLKQDGTGGRVLTLGAAFRVPGVVTLFLSLAANAVDILRIRYSNADGKWEVCNFTNENTIRPIQDIRFVFQKSDNSVLTAAGSEAEKVWGKIDYDCDIISANLEADASGSVVCEMESGTDATSTSNIAASAKPTLSSARTGTDSTLTGWTKFLAAGTTLKSYVSGTPATIKKVTLTLKVRRR